MIPSDDVVLAGSGPLLLLLASQYLKAGVGIQAIIDTTPRSNRPRAVRHLIRALESASYLAKGMGLIASIRRSRVPVYKEVTALNAHGDEVLEAVRFNSRGAGAQNIRRGVLSRAAAGQARHTGSNGQLVTCVDPRPSDLPGLVNEDVNYFR
jgi:hypothetical protein